MKKSIWSIVIVVLVVAVVGSMLGVSLAFADEGKAEVDHSRTVRLAHMSDTHVMIEEWCNPYSQSYASGSFASGKMLGETQELTRTALDDIYAQAIAGDAPMYVFLTGDLTSNGELANTMWVASVLKEYTAKIRAIEGYEGFQFFAIPGNHDIYNQKAGSFMPNPDNADEYAEFWGMSAEQKQAYLASLKKTGVRTTTNLEFVTLFSDFGYCNCPLRKEGKHLPTCGMADGCELEFFYESPFWYDDDTVLSETPVLLDEPLVLVGEELDPEHRYVYDREYKVLSGGGLNAWTLEQGGADMAQAVEDYNASDKDFRITAQYSRHGACSYIARLNGVTVVGFDGDSRRFKALKEDETNMAMLSSDGWNETTGGIILNNMLKWAFDSLATHRDAEQGNLVVCLGHINILPHFDTEDEVISLFTYDNWEQVASNLADHGIRYTFTGHQHAMDIENFVSQSGNILYDFETGSMASMGSGWRDLAVKQTWYTDGAYSEDVASHVNFTDFNDKLDGVDVFRYKLPRVQADGSVAMSTEYEMDGDSYVGIDVALGKGLRNMLGNMIKGYVNDGLYDRIRSMTAGLAGGSMDGVYQLLNDLIDQLADMDFVPFIPNADGTEFTMAESPRAGYGLIDFAEDFVDYILKFDFSYGKSQGGLTLGDLLWQVYGAHLVGAHGDYIADDLLPMLNALDNGDFVRMIEDLIYRGVMPQLEVLLNAPIYWGDVEYVRVDEDAAPVTKADVAGGKGFDLSENGASLLELKFANGMIDVGNIIKKYADISSLRNLIRSLPRILRGIGLIDDNGGVKTSGIMLDVINGLVGRDISKYLGIASDYLDKIDRYPTITLMIKAELLDKYVTTAFCKNLGNYGRYVLESMIRDDSPDGIGWDQAKLQAGSLFPFVVLSTEDSVAFKRGFFNVTPAPLDATNFTVDGVVHTYYRLSDGKDALTVVPTKANGMVPSMITMTNVVGSDGKLDTTQKALRWWTHFDVDVTDVDEDDLSNQKHETFIQWGDAADRLYTQIAVAGDNIRIEYPTIDLGITYLNMTYAYREYNRYDYVLQGLTPGKTYYYRLGSNRTGWTEVYSFEALPDEGGVEYLAIADIQGSVERNYQLSLPNMLEALSKGKPQTVISMGDNVDKGENINQWGWLLDGHDKVYAQHSFETVAGNHEDNAFCISSIVTISDKDVDEPTGYYGSYTYQNMHIVYLNTNDLGEDNALSDEQIDWLEEDLAAARADESVEFVVVCLHKGPFTAGSHAFDTDVIAIRAQLTPILVEYGVDLVLQGHDHTYSVSKYVSGVSEVLDEEDEVIGHTYQTTAPSYDATGAAIDPEGVLFVNMGTMGDKFYNYIYSDEVSLKDRSKDFANQEILSDYFADGKLELKPEYASKGGVATRAECPVYGYLKVTGGRLSLTTYTVIDGVSYVVDDIAITKAETKVDQAISFKVLGNTYHADDLKDVEVVRFAVGGADGITYYAGYRLADLNDKDEFYTSGNKRYEVKDTYVALYSSKTSGEAGTRLAEPLTMVYTPDGVRIVDIEAAQGGLAWWAILLIVLAGVIVVIGVLDMILFIPGKNRKPIVDINALRAKPQKFDNQELTKEESKEEDDVE